MTLVSETITSLVSSSTEGASLATLESILDSIDSDNLTFYESNDNYNITISLADFNLLKIDAVLYTKINLPFQISVYNNTFMKTKISRLVSRKLPNTINWFSNIEFPFEIEINETQSFIIYISIDSLDDVDWLIDNDLAFVLYSDNTTLSEIDFAIRVPDIRGLTTYQSVKDCTLDLDSWYLAGLTDFEDIILKPFRLDDDAAAYSKLRDYENMLDATSDSTYAKQAIASILSDIQENNKLKGFKTLNLPTDFIYNLIYLRESASFRSKFMFNVYEFDYYNGITDMSLNIDFTNAKMFFNKQKSTNSSKISENLSTTDANIQKSNFSGLCFMVRIPFFGSEWMYYDLVFFVINTRIINLSSVEIDDLGEFSGDFIRLQAISNETPSISNIFIEYDISSQVKENLTSFQSFETIGYIKEPDQTNALGQKIINHNVHPNEDFSSIINASDITISYYHTNPILSYKKNYVVYEHSENFRSKLLAYDQYSYFGIDSSDIFPSDNTELLYTIDYTLQKQLYNTDTSDQTCCNTDYTISNNVMITLSNKITYSFKIISTSNISNGSSSILLTDTTKDLNITYIDKIELLNDGNTFLSITGLQLFCPYNKYKYNDKQYKQFNSDMIRSDQISSDMDFYLSLFDKETPIQVMAFNSLTPGESGDLYIVYQLNKNMINEYLSSFFKIPLYLRIEFDNTLSSYICNFATEEFHTIGLYNTYTFDGSMRSNIGGYYPYYQQMFSDIDVNKPSDQQSEYANISNFVDISTINQKSKFHHDVAQQSQSIVKSNQTGGTYVNMVNDEPCSNGVMYDANLTPFSQMFILPIPDYMSKINSINELIGLYNTTLPSAINYRFYIMNFEVFFRQMIEDIRNKYHLVSLLAQSNVMYFRYDISNEYRQYDYEVESITRNTAPFNLSQMSDIYANVTINIPETALNVYTFKIPKELEFAETYNASNDVIGTWVSETYGYSLESSSNSTGRQYFRDRYATSYNLGEITGNKAQTITIATEYFNLFKIKSFDNIDLTAQSIGLSVPDTYAARIITPSLKYAQMVFEFFKQDYTVDWTQEDSSADSIAKNSGNYIISPSYFDLEYIPIDETYSVMVSVTNQNPYSIEFSMLDTDNETSNAIQLLSFPDNADYNKIYLYQITMSEPYTMLAGETVKIFFRIIPRRIGLNFFTVYLNLNNTIRPISFEFRSFVNNKAYFVLSSECKTIDFGDVPIGKYVEEPLIVKNIGNVLGKVNSIYTFGNDAKYFKLLDRSTGTTISERITYNKVVKPKTSLTIPLRFYSQSYGFNYSYCYIETNEPILEDSQQYEESDSGTDYTQLYSNAPKYLVSLLKAQSVIEDLAIETDSYIFLGYVNPLSSKYRTYDFTVNNKNSNKVISIFKITNIMKNYIKVKFSKEAFSTSNSIYITLNPRGYTEGWYYDELSIQMLVYDKITKTKKYILNKVPVSQYVTREQRLSFDIDLEEIVFSTKPFIKTYKKINIRNYSNDDATMYLNLLTDHSGLYTLIPDLSNQTYIIPEGVNYSFMLTFGGDQRFLGYQSTMLTIQFTLGSEVITKYVPVNGVVGDENIIKFYRRNQIVISS